MMADLLLATFGVLGVWVAIAVVLSGLGQMVLRGFGFRVSWTSHGALAFWVGWATTIILLQAWHLRWPVNGYATTLVSVLGAIGWLLVLSRGKRHGRPRPTWASGGHRRATWCGVAVLAVMCANVALGRPGDGDTGLYHLQGVRWAETFAIVPGLANLHDRLGFNNSSFLYAAMLDVGPWERKSHHLANGPLILATIVWLMPSLPRLFRTTCRHWPWHAFQAAFIPVTLLYAHRHFSSLQPGSVAWLLGLIVSIQLYTLLARKIPSAKRHMYVFVVCLLSAVGVTVKLNFLFFGFPAALIALASLWLPRTPKSFGKWKIVGASSAAATVALSVWIARGVILSGYPLFPATVGALDVDWRVPHEQARQTSLAITAWARRPGPDYMESIGNLNWVTGWFLDQINELEEFTIPLFCMVIVGINSIRHYGKWEHAKPLPGRVWLLFLPAIVQVVLVLVKAPTPRFAGASLWILAIGLIVLALDRRDRTSRAFRNGWHLTLVLVAGLTIGAIGKLGSRANGPAPAAFRPIPTVPVMAKTSRYGVRVWIPTRGDAAWDAPLPSTPVLDGRLAWRREGSLAAGFRIRD